MTIGIATSPTTFNHSINEEFYLKKGKGKTLSIPQFLFASDSEKLLSLGNAGSEHNQKRCA